MPDFDQLWNYDDPAGTERAFGELPVSARAADNSAYLAELLIQIARTQGLQRRFAEAHRTLDEAEALAATGGDRARVCYLLERGRVFNSSQQREEEARPYFAYAVLCEDSWLREGEPERLDRLARLGGGRES